MGMVMPEYDDVYLNNGDDLNNIEIRPDMTAEELAIIKQQSLIHSASYADWAIRRIMMLRGQREYINKLYETQVMQLESYKTTQNERIMANEQFWIDRLEEYFFNLRDQGIISPSDKGFTLPHGRLQNRKMPDRWDFSKVNLDYLEQIDKAMVKTEKRVVVKRAKDKLVNIDGKVTHIDSGEIVKDVRFIQGGNKFYVDRV